MEMREREYELEWLREALNDRNRQMLYAERYGLQNQMSCEHRFAAQAQPQLISVYKLRVAALEKQNADLRDELDALNAKLRRKGLFARLRQLWDLSERELCGK